MGVQELVVADYAEDTFVVVDCVGRGEVHDDPGVGLPLDGAFGLREGKDVPWLVEELEPGR